MSDYHTNALTEALRCLHGQPCIGAAHQHLQASAESINHELRNLVVRDIPAFSQSRNPDVLPELARHAPRHTDEILRLLGGGSVSDFEFVQMHAQLRAEQRFPLECTLHAYRCGHKVFSRVLREAVLASLEEADSAPQIVADVADFTLEYTDAISTVFAGAYLSRAQLLAEVEGDKRTQLMNLLLDGYDESDGRVTGVLRNAGYLSGRKLFCVALARAVDPAEMLNPERARRLAESIDKVFESASIKRLVDIRANKVAIIFSSTRRVSGWTANRSGLVDEVSVELEKLGVSVLTAISNECPSTAQIPVAYRQAQHAFEFSDLAQRVVKFRDIPLQALLLNMAGEDFQRMLPGWAREFLEADNGSGGTLLATLRAYADADMNILQAAKSLGVHPNTIYARFQRVADLTGLDAKSYHALTSMLLIR